MNTVPAVSPIQSPRRAPATSKVAAAAASDSKAKPKGKKKGRRRKRVGGDVVTFSASCCKYEVVRDAARGRGWRLVGEEGGDPSDENNIYWIDVSNINERMGKMKPWQRINHFPGMTHIARKARLASTLEKLRREFPRDYSFYPRTWILPADMSDFRQQFGGDGKSKSIFIVKPDAGCQGRGIFLTQDLEKIPTMEPVVAQQYIKRPLLLDGFKFDLRLYVLVTSCTPLRCYLFQDGLVRLATNEYVKPTADNLSNRYMHLTNYAINKHNPLFEANEDAEAGDAGSKRSLKWFMQYISDEFGEAKSSLLWRKMGMLCAKTVLANLAVITREYHSQFGKDFDKKAARAAEAAAEAAGGVPLDVAAAAAAAASAAGDEAPAAAAGAAAKPAAPPPVKGSRCFEVLGVDVMLDSVLKPWLIEYVAKEEALLPPQINHLPSFGADSPLDYDIKSRVIEQAMACVAAAPTDKRSYEQTHRREAEQRLYKSASTAARLGQGGEAAPPRKIGFGGTVSTAPLPAAAAAAPAPAAAAEAAAAGAAPPHPAAEAAATGAADDEDEDGDGAPEVLAPNLQEEHRAAVMKLAVAARRRIVAVLEAHAPDKIAKVDSLLSKYKGREDRLALVIEEKYKNAPLAKTRGKGKAAWAGKGTRATEPDGEADQDGDEAEDVDSDVTDSDVEREEGELCDWDRVYPLPAEVRASWKSHPKYLKIRRFVFDQDEKRMRRLVAPLHQRRVSADNATGEQFPPIGGPSDEYDAPSLWDPFRRGDAHTAAAAWARRNNLPVPPKPEHKPLPVPGPKQVNAADRLMRGFSSRRHSSAPSSLGLGLRDGEVGMQAADRLANAVSYAKQWRRRVEDIRHKKTANAVALKPKMFSFVGEGDLGGGGGGGGATFGGGGEFPFV